MTRKFFGTDGVRGTANKSPMTPDIILKVAIAAGRLFTNGDHKHRVVIGKDTRLSGYMVEAALTSGFLAMGMDVQLLGPIPTPAVALVTRSMRADLGVMITASHNPYYDNGMKFFGPDGYKLSDTQELQIEEMMQDDDIFYHYAKPNSLGQASRIDDASGRYIEWVKNTIPRHITLENLKIVVDCANGAAYRVAPQILKELGAHIVPLSQQPNGRNINKKCGATFPSKISEAVLEHGADLGITIDGDADRLMICDEKGQIVDGDQIIALIAKSFQEKGQLKNGKVVATQMSNMGLEKFLKALNIELIRTKVGDRYVVEYMKTHDINVGGEPSGHIVLRDYATTGDALIAALQILAVVVESGKPVSEVTKMFTPTPQYLTNVTFANSNPLDHHNVQKAIIIGQEKLGNNGRLLVRKSGTEAKIRIMGESEDATLITSVMDDLFEIVSQHINHDNF